MKEGQARQLIRADQVIKALEKVTSLEEVTDLRAQTEAMRGYAKNVRLGLEVQNRVSEAKLRVERKAGEMLMAMDLHGGDHGNQHTGGKVAGCNLADFGIEKTQSHRWQRLARISEEVFEQHLHVTNAAGKEITEAGLFRYAACHGAAEPAPRDRAQDGSPETVTSQREGDSCLVGELLPPVRPKKAGDPFTAIGPAKELLLEARNHRALLASILLPFCEQNQPLKPAERRHAGELIHDLGAVLDQLHSLIR